MSSSMDSPAQTPDPKGPHHVSTELASDGAMDIDSNVDEAAANTASAWDTKKWREDLHMVNSKLQHKNWDPSKRYRDPMSKPLVTLPAKLTPELDSRLREYFQQRKAQQQAL